MDLKVTKQTKTPTKQKKVAAPRGPGRPVSEAPVGDVTRTARAGAYLERLDRVTFAAETNLITNDYRERAFT